MPKTVSVTGNFSVTTTTDTPVLLSPWMMVAMADRIRVVRQIRGTYGDLDTITKFRYAAVKSDTPGSWEAGTGSSQTGAGWVTDNFTISSTSDLWVQVGLFAKEGGTGSAPAGAQATLSASITSEGKVVASRTITMVPTKNTTTWTTVPLAAPMALAGMTKTMTVVVFSSEGGNVVVEPVYRLIDNDPDAGGTWTYLDQPGTWTADTLYNSTYKNLADNTGKALWQPGFRYKNDGVGGTFQVMMLAQW